MDHTCVLLFVPSSVQGRVSLNVLPPLGLLTIASYLESKGIPVDVLDGQVSLDEPNFSRYTTVCIGTNIANARNTVRYIQLIRDQYPQTKIVIGGYQNVDRAGHWLTDFGVDAVIIGEGEFTLHEYLTLSDISKIPGLLYLNEKKELTYNGDRKLLLNLDSIPFPALDKVHLHKYNAPLKKAFPVSSISTSRGCPEKCTFCYSREGVWRQRSAKNVVDEIEWQVNTLGVKELWITDDNFTLNRQRSMDIAQMIIDRKIKVYLQLKNGIRVDKVDRELLTKLKEAGLWLLSVAPESGNQETLDRIQKGFTLEKVKEIVDICKDVGITTCGMFILGFPWETEKDMEKTITFADGLDTDLVQFARYTPIEGTPIYEDLKKEGMIREDEFDDISIQTGFVNYQSKMVPKEYFRTVYKTAYRRYYFKPRRIVNLMRKIPLSNIASCVKYGVQTESL
ncbi:MAG: radical SAM protein [bacterium]|nr:radical SAM protein [bacterium]